MNKQISQILHKAEPFKHLSAEDMSLLFKYGHIKSFQAGAHILSQGKLGEGIFVLLEGEADVSVKILGQGDIQLAKLKKGDFFGEVNVLIDEVCTATITANNHVECFLITKPIYHMLSLAFPDIHHSINKGIVSQVLIRQSKMMNEIIQKKSTQFRKIIQLAQSETHRSFFSPVKLSKSLQKDCIAWLDNTTSFNQVFSKDEAQTFIKHSNIYDGENIILDGHFERNDLIYLYIVSGSLKCGIKSSDDFINTAVFGPGKLICVKQRERSSVHSLAYQVYGKTTLMTFSQKQIKTIYKENSPLWYKLEFLGNQYIVSLQQYMNTHLVRLSCETPFKATSTLK